MTGSGATNPSERARRMPRGGEPPHMSEAEKIVCEWEARHDVAARGRLGSPDVLQRYLTHERYMETHHSVPAPRRPAAPVRERGTSDRPDGMATGSAPPAEPALPPDDRGSRRRWGLFRRSRRPD